MKKITLMTKFGVGIAFLLPSFLLQAGTQPKFTLIPTTPTTKRVPVNGVDTVGYLVTNQTELTRTLTIVPIAGIRQNTSGVGVCSSPFTLAPQESCLLNLVLSGEALPKQIIGGPKVCKNKDTK